MTPHEYTEHLRAEASDAATRTLDLLIEQGKLKEDEAIDSIVALLDALVPLQALIPGPIGTMLEAADDIAIRKMVEGIASVMQREEARSRRREQKNARLKRRDAVKATILGRMKDVPSG